MDTAVVPIHNHTEYSPLDGLSTCAEAAAMAVANGSPALAITDHGWCAGHPQHQAECDRLGLQPLFGMETYFQPDRLVRPGEGDKEGQKRLRGGRHLILLAQGNRGLHDLWTASTEAYATGHYGKPRMDWNLLEDRGSDLIATTSCLGGVISQDLLNGRYDEAWATLDRLKAIFPGRLYLEIQPNELPDQIRLNQMLALASETFGVPLVVATDAHYPSEEDKPLHDLWMACQAGGGKDDYWHFSAMLGSARIRELLGYLDPKVVEASMRATQEIAGACTARIDAHYDPPVFGASAEEDARRLRQLCEQNWDRIRHPSQAHRDRMEFEFRVVAEKRYAGCYLIVEDIVRWVRGNGWLVGPGRGSAAGSLMSYLLDITSIDPLDAGLMFERFLTPGRAALPDFDMDFASSKRGAIQDYAVRRYGADHVVRVGTVMRYGPKGIINKLFSVMGQRLASQTAGRAEGDARQIGSLIDEAEAGTAGLGLPWDELMADQALQEYIERYEIVFRIARALNDRVYSVGQHPAGLIISPGVPLTGTMPMRLADTSKTLLVSQFDYRTAEALGLLKLDFLTLRTLDSLQLACELVAKRTGTMPDPRSWDAEHHDPQVYDEIGTGQTLGMFQIETSLCVDYCRRMKPRTIGHLADLTTFIRPGPRNSGATEQYLRRFAGLEEVDYPHPDLAEHLARSYGLLLYQEDVLTACKVLGGYDDLEADGVRKILGKKLTDKIEAAGEEFIRRCTERGHDEEQIRALWEKIAEFGKYAFNRAHAYSYATLTDWTAWFMTHYPVEMTAAILSTLDKMDRMAPFAVNARRRGIAVLPPDVRFSGADFAVGQLSVTYGLSAIPKVGPAAVSAIVRSQPYSSYKDFRDRSGVNAGVLYALARAGALDALVPSRKGLIRVIESDRDGSSVRCVHKDPDVSGPHGLPCTYDWAQEARGQESVHAAINQGRAAAGRRQLKLTVKDPPAKCTRACRRYTPPESADLAAFGEYRPSEMFRQDFDTFGTWMSDLPFRQLDEFGPGVREQARQVARVLQEAPEGTYPLAAVYAGSHTASTRTGNTMWWVQLVTEVSSLDLACFSPRRDGDPDVPGSLRGLRAGTLVFADVVKRGYTVPGRGPRMGWRLDSIRPIGR